MNGNLAKSVGAAARAAWGTVVLGAAWLTVGYVVWLVILDARPAWVLALWGGGDLAWSTVQEMSLWFTGAFKAVLFVVVLAAVWLSLWARGLKRAA